jgi:hypothetical protein
MRRAASAVWILSGAALGVGFLLFCLVFWAADTVRPK